MASEHPTAFARTVALGMKEGESEVEAIALGEARYEIGASVAAVTARASRPPSRCFVRSSSRTLRLERVERRLLSPQHFAVPSARTAQL